MNSSFSRNFSMAATILLLTLTILGASFQIQINSFLEDTTVSRLTQDSQVVANLAGAYGMDGNLASRDLMLNLDVVSQITNADLVICDNDGYITLCSGSLNGCAYDGWQLNQDFLDKVYENGGYSATGTIRNLYDEERYVVSAPIVSGEQRLGIVIVSTPTAGTKQVLNKISNIFLTVSVFVVLIAVLGVMAFARRESKPLKELAKAATAFGHGELDARVKIDEDSSEEMEELALAFNNMASSLQKSEYARQEFVANVSHELKTPMTTISGYVDGILDGTIPEEKRSEFAVVIEDGICFFEGIQERQDACIKINMLFNQNMWCSLDAKHIEMIQKLTELGVLDDFSQIQDVTDPIILARAKIIMDEAEK